MDRKILTDAENYLERVNDPGRAKEIEEDIEAAKSLLDKVYKTNDKEPDKDSISNRLEDFILYKNEELKRVPKKETHMFIPMKEI